MATGAAGKRDGHLDSGDRSVHSSLVGEAYGCIGGSHHVHIFRRRHHRRLRGCKSSRPPRVTAASEDQRHTGPVLPRAGRRPDGRRTGEPSEPAAGVGLRIGTVVVPIVPIGARYGACLSRSLQRCSASPVEPPDHLRLRTWPPPPCAAGGDPAGIRSRWCAGAVDTGPVDAADSAANSPLDVMCLRCGACCSWCRRHARVRAMSRSNGPSGAVTSARAAQNGSSEPSDR